MILKHTPAFIVIHQETGLTFQVYCIDLFCEEYVHCDGQSESIPNCFIHEERYYETETKQQVIRDLKGRKGIWVIKTEQQQQWYVKEIER